MRAHAVHTLEEETGNWSARTSCQEVTIFYFDIFLKSSDLVLIVLKEKSVNNSLNLYGNVWILFEAADA